MTRRCVYSEGQSTKRAQRAMKAVGEPIDDPSQCGRDMNLQPGSGVGVIFAKKPGAGRFQDLILSCYTPHQHFSSTAGSKQSGRKVSSDVEVSFEAPVLCTHSRAPDNPVPILTAASSNHTTSFPPLQPPPSPKPPSPGPSPQSTFSTSPPPS